MTGYLLILILAVGIPFLLYCLWNFARELSPHMSAVFVSSSVSRPNAHNTVAAAYIKNRARIGSFQNECGAAS